MNNEFYTTLQGNILVARVQGASDIDGPFSLAPGCIAFYQSNLCQINVTLSEFAYSRFQSFDQTQQRVPPVQITLTTENDFHSARSNNQVEMHATRTPIQIFERPKAMWHSYPQRIIALPVSWKRRGKNNEVTSDQKPVF